MYFHGVFKGDQSFLMSSSLKVTQYMHQPASQLYSIWMSIPKFLYSASLCFFDKLQPIIAQFDPVLFAS